uniref:Uncharacterized protein n=1 Tax=Arundo donax TaxID=35708 RepID=A0A0A9F6H1_ARUDO
MKDYFHGRKLPNCQGHIENKIRT